MSKARPVIAVLVLTGAILAVLALKNRNQEWGPGSVAPEPQDPVTLAQAVTTTNDIPGTVRAEPPAAALPRLVDLGADKCIPCKMMAPILAELRKEFAGTFNVEFIDVWKNAKAGEPYGIRMIPTQVFYDAGGKELFRHEGFFGKDEILAKWKEFGVTGAAGAEEQQE